MNSHHWITHYIFDVVQGDLSINKLQLLLFRKKIRQELQQIEVTDSLHRGEVFFNPQSC